MKFVLIGFLLFLMSCGDNYDKVDVSNCIGGYVMQTFSASSFDERDVKVEDNYPDDEWFEERHDGGFVDPYGKIISLEDNKMTIDFVSNFNCGNHIRYSVKYDIEGETLHLSIRSEDDGILALCVCPKVLTFSVDGEADKLKKLNKIIWGRSEDNNTYESPLFNGSGKCVVNGKTYEIGERFTVWCNICICTEEGAGCDEDACSCSSGSKEMFPCNDEGDIVVEWCECLNPMEGYSCIEDPVSQCE